MVAETAKGEARRTALQDAVIRVLEHSGSGAVTHRAVAAEAGVPLAAATYYFANIDDLFVSALLRVTAQQVTLFTPPRGVGGLANLATLLHDWAYDSRASAIAHYELLFLSMRHDSLRAAADLWYRALEDAIDPLVPDPRHARVVALAVDGLILRMLWRGDPGSVAAVHSALRDILEAPSGVI